VKPIRLIKDSNEVVLQCEHGKRWPPGHARLGIPFEVLRQRRQISEVEYQRLQTWQRTCGLLEMVPSRCTECPAALVETEDGPVPYLEREPRSPAPPFMIRKKAIRCRES
jgi:hypothetical protein